MVGYRLYGDIKRGGMTRVVAIHQPNFFPWLGYFDKLYKSDVFIFLNHVQFAKTGGTWSNRVKMRIGGEVQWVTAPVQRTHHNVIAVDQVVWDDSRPWREKFYKSLISNYGRAAFYEETIELVKPLIFYPTSNLSDFNLNAISTIAAHVSLRIDHCYSSRDLDVASHSNDMLIELTKRFDGTAYLCGGGAGDYQDDDAFRRAGLDVFHQHYLHPMYPQGVNDFHAGLSIVDALMHVGAAGTHRLLVGA
jgi:WbqC-like protein family